VFIDPNASFRRRAPAPVQLGRGLAAADHGEGECRGHGVDRSTPDAEHLAADPKISSPDSAAGGESDIDMHGFTAQDLSAIVANSSPSNTPMKGADTNPV
jgi:hypothetical protein